MEKSSSMLERTPFWLRMRKNTTGSLVVLKLHIQAHPFLFFFRKAYAGGAVTWNLRDRHMHNTLKEILEHYRDKRGWTKPKAGTHIATESSKYLMLHP